MTMKAIVQILRRGNGEIDCQIWHNNRTGVYYTREGYDEWLSEFKENHEVQAQGSPTIWKRV